VNRAVERLASEVLLRGPVFEVVGERVRLPSGREQRVQIVRHPGAVAIAPLLPSGELLLVRQYRAAVEEWLIEVPAGRLEPDEDPRAGAERELEEETGQRARRWDVLLCFVPAPGFCSERVTLFLARDLEPVASPRAADPDEELELVRRRPDAILAGGEVHDAKTLLAAAWLTLHGIPS
jgi:ADP-ribose pyrophosphatase